jgi:two-component sensor histidine kinase
MFSLQQLRGAALRSPSWTDGKAVLAIFLATALLREFGLIVAPGVPMLIFLPAISLVTLAYSWRWGLVLVVADIALAGSTVPRPFWHGDAGLTSPGLVLAMFAVVGVLDVVILQAIRGLLQTTAAQRAEVAELARQRGELIQQHDTAFREMQHRVANNLQYVSNMLQLSRIEADRGGDVRDVLDKALARLSAMAQLHRQLNDITTYKQGVEQILRAILDEVLDPARIDICLRIDPVALTTEQMTALVLFVTEAATNADKHVFRHGAGARFEVVLDRRGTDMLRLSVRDDGPRIVEPVLTAMGVAPRPKGLGMRIMHGLAHQLGGTFETGGSAGTIFVDFKAA